MIGYKMGNRFFYFFCLIIFVSTNSAMGLQSQLSVTDVINSPGFADRVPISATADGMWIAYTLSDTEIPLNGGKSRAYFSKTGTPRGQRGTSVYVANTLTGYTKKLVDGLHSSWAPAWSPDGKLVAFYSDHDGHSKVWIWNRETEELSLLLNRQVRAYWGFEQLQWSPDGSRILVKLMPSGKTVKELNRLYPSRDSNPGDEEKGGTRVYQSNLELEKSVPAHPQSQAVISDIETAPSFLNVQYGDLVVVDVESKKVTPVANMIRAMYYRFSNQGDEVVYSVRQPDGGNGNLVFDLYDIWVGTPGSEPKKVVAKARQEYGLGFSWSPNDEQIAYTSGNDVHVFDLKRGEVAKKFTQQGLDLSHDYRPPLWIENDEIGIISRNTLWKLSTSSGNLEPLYESDEHRLLDVVADWKSQHIDSDHILVATLNRSTKETGFKKINLETGQGNQEYLANRSFGSDLTYQLVASNDETKIVFISESGGEPQDIWVVDNEFENVKRVTNLSPNVSKLVLGKSQLISWKNDRDETLYGALLLPSNYEEGKKYPLIVKVYGGSMLSNTVNRFGLQGGVDNLQLLATRGYAVLLPDAPTRIGSPMQDIASAVEDGAQKVVDMGIADPERLAVYGHSFGGYSALATGVVSPIFKTIISSAGFSNMFSRYTDMRANGSVVGIGWSERGQGKMAGHPWEFQERYKKNSPFFYLDQISGSVLLLHGGADRTVPVRSAEETFVGLRRLNKPAKLVVYEGEDHHPGSFSTENAVSYWNEVFEWLKVHL